MSAKKDAADKKAIRVLRIIKKDFKGCRERDSNPHSHHWPRDFKSLVSTNSTITARFCECKGTKKLELGVRS